MAELCWSNEDYSVGISAIDNEHKLLIALINDFEASLNIDVSLHSQIVTEKLDRLSTCIRKHFESEERFLLFNNYPLFTEHQEEHTQLLERLSKFEARFKAENKPFNEKILLFLKDWLVRHIILHDRKFCSYFRDKEPTEQYG